MTKLLITFLAILLPTLAMADLHKEMIAYNQVSTPLEGYLVYQEGQTGKRPGVLIVHDWMGLGDFYKSIADKLADMGYVAFAVDIYGKGLRPKDSKEAGAFAGKYKNNRALLRDRVKAGLNQLLANPHVDPSRVAAIGYCFGGTTVLELARSGADIAGVVSFHGGLDTPDKSDGRNIKAKVLALHGADDPHVPMEHVIAFMDEMRASKVDWQLVIYGNAVHAFTLPAAGTDNAKGVAYNEKADKRSWEAMKLFFREIFKQPND